MGALFKTPSPPPPPPLPKLDTPDPEEDERKTRLEALRRRRRGLAGTVRTTQRGILRERNENTSGDGKERLGE